MDLERTIPRKIFDVVVFNDELELLETHIREVAPFIDYIVIVESNMTFQGKPKRKLLTENMGMFCDIQEKIILVDCDLSQVDGGGANINPWSRENESRNCAREGRC